LLTRPSRAASCDRDNCWHRCLPANVEPDDFKAALAMSNRGLARRRSLPAARASSRLKSVHGAPRYSFRRDCFVANRVSGAQCCDEFWRASQVSGVTKSVLYVDVKGANRSFRPTAYKSGIDNPSLRTGRHRRLVRHITIVVQQFIVAAIAIWLAVIYARRSRVNRMPNTVNRAATIKASSRNHELGYGFLRTRTIADCGSSAERSPDEGAS
jgi:hypothetical protein